MSHIGYPRSASAPPADRKDWPGWFRTPRFQTWLTGASGIKILFPAEYRTWRSVRARCRKGGGVLDPAFETFRRFLTHILPAIGCRPSKLHTLDRLNPVDPVYGPGRVRWADKRLQAANRTSTLSLLQPDGRGTVTVREAATRTGTLANTIRTRKRRGWTDAEAITGRRRTGSTGAKAAEPCVWPPVPGLDHAGLARGYAAFLAALAPAWRPSATRLLFLSALYGTTRESAAKSAHAQPRAAAWLAEHETTADQIVALLSPAAMQMHRALARDWMTSTSGSHEHRCGCMLARHGIALARHEMNWITLQPVPPVLPAPPRPYRPPAPWDHTDPGNIDPGDHDPGDHDPGND